MIPEISVPLIKVNNSTYSMRKESHFGLQVKQMLCSDSGFLFFFFFFEVKDFPQQDLTS